MRGALDPMHVGTASSPRILVEEFDAVHSMRSMRSMLCSRNARHTLEEHSRIQCCWSRVFFMCADARTVHALQQDCERFGRRPKNRARSSARL